MFAKRKKTKINTLTSKVVVLDGFADSDILCKFCYEEEITSTFVSLRVCLPDRPNDL